MVFQNDILAGSSGGSSASSVYKIDQSIRFNASDYPKMTRTPSSAGNRRTFTLSTWIKRGALSTDQVVFGSYINTTNYFLIYFDGTSHSTDNTFRVYEYNGNVLKFWVYGTQKFRDPSAWYHFVVSVDTTNAVSNERIRLYVNGSRITDLTQNQQPALNYETYINSTNLQTIGEFYGNYYHFDGYMAEMHLLDGYAYDPSYFGLFNENGIWIPKEYSGSYGTNGFHIKGESASDLGNDSSSNNNDFTTSGLASHDQMVGESPTNNFCTYNSIQLQSGATLSNGNLDAVSSGSSWRNVHSTIGVSSGKWYWEVKADVINSSQTWVAGIQETSFESKANYWWQAGYTASSSGIVFGVLDSNYKVTNVTRTSFTHDIAQGDIVQFQLNLDDNELSVLVDGVSKGKIYDITANTEYTPAVCLYSTSSATINFGQDGTFGGTETAGGNSDGNGIGNFKYSVPSGYLALCTKNLGS